MIWILLVGHTDNKIEHRNFVNGMNEFVSLFFFFNCQTRLKYVAHGKLLN